MREAAERVLFGQSLEEKLRLPPRVVDDSEPGKAIAAPDGPGRPEELRVVAKGVRAEFPGTNRLDDEHERGVMMHFLANHELLAAELMALVLLKFPDAPKEYRAGVYEAMREEQMHTRMYLRRMRECGIHFGELPVNDYFWRLVSPMRSPMEFVTRLNLTFEQANLDFSKHYAGLFRQVGDAATAGVLEKIYHDEIGHVGHGVKWFRHWKERGESDWEAFRKFMVFPFAAAKAKGIAPFNAEGRRLAGLDDDFIRRLEVCEQSRGRTPVVHWFNPYAEEEVSAAKRGESFTPKKMAAAMEADAEMVMLGWCRRDDIIVVRQRPSDAHLAYLQQAGFHLPEIMTPGQLDGRKLGGMRPWAWSPEVSSSWRRHAGQVSPSVPWQWREPLPADYLSKEIGVRLLQALGLDDRPRVCDSLESAEQAVAQMLMGDALLLKGVHACAGRDQFRVESVEAASGWLPPIFQRHGAVLVERWRERVADFSILYEVTPEGVDLAGMTVMENDAFGRYVGSRVAPKWGSLLDPEVAGFLYRDADVTDWIEGRLPDAIKRVLPGYSGPVGVDSMVFRNPDGTLGWSPVVELNVRMTMGRVALELMRKSRPGSGGCLRIHRKMKVDASKLQQLQSGSLNAGPVVLNDPDQAQEFLVVWEVDAPKS